MKKETVDRKGIPSKEAWQVNLDLTPAGDNIGNNAFLPRSGKDRPTTHVKVNECDY